MNNPRIANAQPMRCLGFICIFVSFEEKNNVVIKVAPLSIINVDPEIIAKAEHCITTVTRSAKAGTK